MHNVEPQAYITVGAESPQVDFLITNARLVIEVDGYAKDRSPPTSSDMEKRNRREAVLMAHGYTVLHFTNAQVQQGRVPGPLSSIHLR